LTQSLPPSEQTGWWPDPTHAPDLDYIPYLMTGSRYYLDQLNAEADFDVVSTWPAIRQGAQGLVAFSDTQARTQAWSIREIAEAAAANPDGSAEKSYFATILNNNINFLLSEAAAAHQGQSSGWIPSGGGVGRIQPWQQDFFATTAALAAEQGVPGAKQLLEGEIFAGRFLAAAPSPTNIAYFEMFTRVAQTSPYQRARSRSSPKRPQARRSPRQGRALRRVRALRWPATSRLPHRRTRYTHTASSSRIRPKQGSPTSSSSPDLISFLGCRMDNS
jgi:hypothetical protein